MKIIIIESIWVKPHLETAGEIALNLRKEGHDVSFAWVGSNPYWNEWDIPKIVKILGGNIENRIKNFQNLLRSRQIKIIDSNSIFEEKNIKIWAKKFDGNLNNLKNYKYKTLPLGMGVASSLVSYYNSKNLNLISIISKVKQLLCTSAFIYEKSLNIITKYNPDKIITFNNRFASSLPIILAAQQKKIKILRHDRGSNFKKYHLYKFDINDPRNFRDIYKNWKKNKNQNKYKIANNFFKKKFLGTFKDEVNKNYTANQNKNTSPFIPKDKIIITFYCSTEYETDAYINLKYNQMNAFKKFFKTLKKFKNIYLIIRVHPSLSNKENLIWKKFVSKNVILVSSTSGYDTYEIMRKSNVVCAYASRIVLESAFLGIPTICLRSFGWPKNIGILYGENEKKIQSNLSKCINKKIKFNLDKILSVSYFYSTYGFKYKYYKPSSINEGIFLGDNLNWKSKFIIFLENFGINKLYKNFKKYIQ